MLFLNEDLCPRKRTDNFLDDLMDWDLWKPRKRMRWLTEDDFDDDYLPHLAVCPKASPKKSTPKAITRTRRKSLEQKQKKADKIEPFCVKMDVQHFKPDEIEIKVVNNDLVVTGKHKERADEEFGGFVCRQFTRRYELPENCDTDLIMSSLTTDGKLTIEAPIKIPEEKSVEKVVPINVVPSPQKKLTTTITRADEEEADESEQ